MGDVALVVPFASDDPHRVRNWRWVADRYSALHGWEANVGTCAGAWSKGAAVANAVARTTADVLVIADADSFVPVAVLDDAIALARVHGWAVPHDVVWRLTEADTADLLARGPLDRIVCPHWLDKSACAAAPGGGVVVVTRDAYETVGGIDREFVGWGWEDVAFGNALTTLVGPPARLSAPLVHLWHPEACPTRQPSPETLALAQRYRRAYGRRAEMAKLVGERR